MPVFPTVHMRATSTFGAPTRWQSAVGSDPAHLLSIATYNVHDLYDAADDPATNDPVSSPGAYAHHLAKTAAAIVALGSPDVIGLQEVENQHVLDDLLKQPALQNAGYTAVIAPGGNDAWSHNDGLLYRSSAVTLKGMTFENPAKAYTDGQRAIDPSLTFTSPPAIAEFSPTNGGAPVTVIVNHLKSKLGGHAYDERRLDEGRIVGSLVDRATAADPAARVVVLGDMNAETRDPQLQAILRGTDGRPRMVEATDRLPDSDRFSYIFHGQHNLLDHVMVTPSLESAIRSVQIPHFDTQPNSSQVGNASAADGASDHDGVVITLDPTAA